MCGGVAVRSEQVGDSLTVRPEMYRPPPGQTGISPLLVSRIYGFKSFSTYVALEGSLRSIAYSCKAASISRRLLMQPFAWAGPRARAKFGIAIAQIKAMIATTIMISTRVNPAVEQALILDWLDLFLIPIQCFSEFTHGSQTGLP